MKLDRKQDLNVLYQVCVFRAGREKKMTALASDWLWHFWLLWWNRWTEINEVWQEARWQCPLPSLCFWADLKNKMVALASGWLRHFRLLLWNRWTEFNETWQEARSKRLLPSLCYWGRSQKQDGRPGLWLAETFSTSSLKQLNGIQRNLTRCKMTMSSTKFVFLGRSEKQDDRPGLWLAETFSTSSLKPLNGIQRNLTGSKLLTSSTKFLFFGPVGKKRWPPWPLIGWDIFDFFSETAERNSTKFDRKEDLNVLYQVCVFGPIGKIRWPPWPLIGWDIFDFFSETAEQNSTANQRKLDRKQDLNVFYQVCVFGLIGKTRWKPQPLIGWDIFNFFSETAEPNSTKLDRKQDLNVLYQVCVFRADR